jgi:hypothetical protein
MNSSEPKHLLNAQRQARENRITHPHIRKHLYLLPLEQRVKSTSSVSSSNKSSSYVSPALQSSQERPPHKPTRSHHKPTLPPPKTPRPSANGTQNSKRPKQKLEQEPEQKLQVKRNDLGPLDSLPDHLITKILKMSIVIDITAYSLRTWINPDKLQLVFLTKNPNSISFFDTLFKRDPEVNIHWNLLSKNPNAIELIKKRMKYLEVQKIDINNLERSKQINWNQLSENPNAIELLKQKISKERFLHPNTLENLTYYQKIDWKKLCMNPNAIELLKENIHKITKSIFANKNIDEEIITTLLEDREEFWDESWQHIPQAMQFLTKYKSFHETKDHILWNELSQNTSTEAIELLKAKALEEKQLSDKDYKALYYKKVINWDNVSNNPKAIELLKDKIAAEKTMDFSKFTLKYRNVRIRFVNWNKLSSNPKAIALLTAKAEEEQQLRADNFESYKSLHYILKIDWYRVSLNPKAISLLETKALDEKHLRDNDNDKYLALSDTELINWNDVSSNPKAIKLLTVKAEEEKQFRANKKYLTLRRDYRINWDILSSDTKAIALLETKIKDEIQAMQAMQDAAPEVLHYTCKINHEKLSANPKAVKLLEKYPEYISLKGLCSNPNAVKLIKKQVLLEDLLTNEKINWDILSMNPCIFYETS